MLFFRKIISEESKITILQAIISYLETTAHIGIEAMEWISLLTSIDAVIKAL